MQSFRHQSTHLVAACFANRKLMQLENNGGRLRLSVDVTPSNEGDSPCQYRCQCLNKALLHVANIKSLHTITCSLLNSSLQVLRGVQLSCQAMTICAIGMKPFYIARLVAFLPPHYIELFSATLDNASIISITSVIH